MKHLKKALAILLACAVLVAVAAGCGAQSGSKDDGKSATGDSVSGATKDSGGDATKDSAGKTAITFVLDWKPNTNHTGLYVAQEKGWLDEAGVDLEIQEAPEDGAEMLVGAGKAQFGVSFQDYLLPYVAGDNKMPVAAVAALMQHNTSGIISLKGKGMDRPKGLEGKKYATWDLPIEQGTLRRVVEADGGDFEKVVLVSSTVYDLVSTLQDGSVDAVWIYYGWDGIATEVAGLATDYFAFKDIDPVFDYYTPVIIGNTDWTAAHPEETKRFLSAVKKGYEYAVEHPEEAADILLKHVPELDSEQVKKSQAYVSQQYKADVERWGYMDPARWNAFYHWVDENKLFEAEIPENAGFTNDYLE